AQEEWLYRAHQSRVQVGWKHARLTVSLEILVSHDLSAFPGDEVVQAELILRLVSDESFTFEPGPRFHKAVRDLSPRQTLSEIKAIRHCILDSHVAQYERAKLLGFHLEDLIGRRKEPHELVEAFAHGNLS